MASGPDSFIRKTQQTYVLMAVLNKLMAAWMVFDRGLEQIDGSMDGLQIAALETLVDFHGYVWKAYDEFYYRVVLEEGKQTIYFAPIIMKVKKRRLKKCLPLNSGLK
ncbi:hypothetical protein OROHE_006270 [Orobanche hederae]